MTKFKYKLNNQWAEISAEDVGAASPNIIIQGNVNPNKATNITDDTILYIDNSEYIDDKHTIIQVDTGELKIPIQVDKGGTGAGNALEARNNLGITVQWLVNTLYPVGSIYISTNSTSPGTLFPGTVWQSIPGRFLVGVGKNDGTGTESLNISDVRQKSGEANHLLSTSEIPVRSHYHKIDLATTSAGAHTHSMGTIWSNGSGSSSAYAMTSSRALTTRNTGSAGAHTHKVTGYVQATPYANTSASTQFTVNAHNNLPPYYAVYIWERTA